MNLDPFYLIVDNADWLARLLPCGVKFVQLRLKDLPDDALRAHISKARELCLLHGAQLVVNDYWRLAIELGCDFIHLGQEDLLAADIVAIRKAGVRLGISTHDDSELSRGLEAYPDYVALGPVFPTILKEMPWAPQGLDRVADWKSRLMGVPLVGIGGLNIQRGIDVLRAGADSVAVVTDISLNADPEARTKAWVEATRPFAAVRD